MPSLLAAGNRLNKFRGLTSSMMGNGQFQAPNPSGSYQLPANYGFGDLAQYEEARRNDFAKASKQNILGYADEFSKNAAARRASLISSLTDLGQKTFSSANPSILEDLNSRGLLTSQTARDQEQGRLLQDIALKNQDRLLTEEGADNRTLEDIRQSALAADLQSQQDALDSGLDLRRGGLEASRADAQAAEERRTAEELAKEQRKSGITNALIGAGGSILGGYLMRGGIGSFLGGGAGGAGAAGVGAAGIPAGVGLSGILSTGAGLLGGGYAGQRLSRLTGKVTRESKAGSAIGAGLGTALGGPLGGVAGGAIGGLGVKGVQGVGKALKRLCFDASTPITMSDGSCKLIKDIDVGDETKGGMVESVRKSITEDGTRYNYFGTIVTGSHALLENGKWKRVENAEYSKPFPGSGIVYSIVTDKHRIYIEGITYADEHESDFYEDLTIDQSLDYLNAEQLGKTLLEVE